MDAKGTLYIIAAASGTGKTSLAEALAQKITDLKISISHTTRVVSVQEEVNRHYFYVTVQEFEQLIQANKFLEYARVFGNYYGTSREFVEQQLCRGIDIILDIDWQGARQIREKMPCKTIFLLPPSKQELRQRLERRQRESTQVIEERLRVAGSEIAHYQEFDYIIINDNFSHALADLEAIVRANRLQLGCQRNRYEKLLAELIEDC